MDATSSDQGLFEKVRDFLTGYPERGTLPADPDVAPGTPEVPPAPNTPPPAPSPDPVPTSPPPSTVPEPVPGSVPEAP